MQIGIFMDATKKKKITRQKYAVSVDRICEEYRTFDIFYILAYCPHAILFYALYISYNRRKIRSQR